MAQNLGFWHEVTMLLGTGVPRRRRPKNGADRKSARGARATLARPCQGEKLCGLEMAARVRVGVGFWKVAARVFKGETLPHRPYIKGVEGLVSNHSSITNTLRE